MQASDPGPFRRPPMAVDHYENFPVASVLLPARLRHPVALIYRFAREADDFADEGDARARACGSQQLDRFRQQLRPHRARRRRPKSPGSRSSATVIRDHRPAASSLFHDLLSAFSPGRHARRATRITPRCSTTAGARPTRSGGCCSSCTARATRAAPARGRTRSARACSSSTSCRTSRSTTARTASTCRRTRWRASA